MELKEFIKGVLADITNAIKESQDELNNGVVVNPGSVSSTGAYATRGFAANDIDFDVALTVSTDRENGIGINVLSSQFGRNTSKEMSEISRVKFSIPILYPRPKHSLDK